MSAPEDAGVKPSLDLSTASADPFEEEQTMLILVGLIASGKNRYAVPFFQTTFAEALESHFPRFRRCSQDDLGNRQRVEEVACRTLSEGFSPCIDRSNFNATQRSYWTAIARAFPGTSISIIVFDTPYQVCASRLERRISHPTIRDARQGMAVLQKFASDFQMPSPDEGYDHVIHLQPADHPHPEYARNDILSILARLKASTRNAGTSGVRQRNMESFFGRGGSNSRIDRARGSRGFSPARGSRYGSSRFTSRVGGSNSSDWGRLSSDAITTRERSDQRSAACLQWKAQWGANSAEEHYNSS